MDTDINFDHNKETSRKRAPTGTLRINTTQPPWPNIA